MALPQKFRTEQNAVGVILFPNGGGIAHRNGGLNNHHRIGIALQYQLDHRLYRRGVKEILLAVVVGGGSDHDKICLAVRFLAVQRCRQIQVLLRQILLDFLVNNGRFSLINEIDLLRHDIHGVHLVMLCHKNGIGQSDITGSGDCNCHILIHFFHSSYAF